MFDRLGPKVDMEDVITRSAPENMIAYRKPKLANELKTRGSRKANKAGKTTKEKLSELKHESQGAEAR